MIMQNQLHKFRVKYFLMYESKYSDIWAYTAEDAIIQVQTGTWFQVNGYSKEYAQIESIKPFVRLASEMK